jgi:hypothetical protein
LDGETPDPAEVARLVQEALDYCQGLTNKVINTINDLFAFLADLSDPLPNDAMDYNVASTWRKQVELKLNMLIELRKKLNWSMMPPDLQDDWDNLMGQYFYLETWYKNAFGHTYP